MDEYESMHHQENLNYLNSQDIIAPSYANVYQPMQPSYQTDRFYQSRKNQQYRSNQYDLPQDSNLMFSQLRQV